MPTNQDKCRSMYSSRWRGTCRLVRTTGSAVRTRGPITIHSASAYVIFSGAETRNFQKKSQAFNMTRKQILKRCHGNPKTRKSARAHNLRSSNVITIWKLLFCICLFYCVLDNQFWLKLSINTNWTCIIHRRHWNFSISISSYISQISITETIEFINLILYYVSLSF